MAADLSRLLVPKSVAIVGASSDPKKLGAIVLRNIVDSGFGGQVWPVNPKYQELSGKKCYPDMKGLPGVPDLVVVAIPAAAVMEVITQAGEAGIKAAVVFSAGFGELGEEGKKQERELAVVAAKYEMALLGPNCLGLVNNNVPINATFSQVVKNNGNLRFISQSGAIASSVFDWAEVNGVGFSEFVTLGNKAAIGENEVLEYWLTQEAGPAVVDEKLSDNRPVGLYLESIVDGVRFMEAVSRTAKKHPVLVLKPGKSEAAARAMQSHTGAIAGEDAVLEAALKQAGAIRCMGLEDLFDFARAFAWENAPSGPRVAVVSNAGGPAVLAADAVAMYGLTMAPISDEARAKLKEKLPREASLLNPIDVLGDALAGRYVEAIEVALSESSVDALVVILTPQVMTQIKETAEMIGQISGKYKKPVLCSFVGGSHVAAGEMVLNSYKIPSFRYPERAIAALSAMWRWQEWRSTHLKERVLSGAVELGLDKGKVEEILGRAKAQGRGSLDSLESNGVLMACGMTAPAMAVVESDEQVHGFVDQVGWPVVVKLSSYRLLHKTEAGGVRTGVGNHEELARVVEEMKGRIGALAPEMAGSVKVVVQKQVSAGVEVIMGVKRDKSFGPVVMFGAGGTLTELVLDRNLHLLPMGFDEAMTLIENSRVYKLLAGFRGDSAYDIEKIAVMLSKLARTAGEFPQIAEIEINPVIVTHQQVWAVDGKVLLENNEQKTENNG